MHFRVADRSILRYEELGVTIGPRHRRLYGPVVLARISESIFRVAAGEAKRV
jgi:hypothetical protein